MRILVVSLLAVFLAAPPVAASPSSISVLATEGLSVDATTTYTLDIDAEVVRVRAEILLTNTSPPVNVGYGTRHYYFDQFPVFAIGPTANVRATRDGTPLAVDIEEPDADVDILVVRLSPTLDYGAPQSIVVEYDLPAQPAGSDSVTRVNGAFATWYVASVGEDGASNVVIDVPERFELETVTDATGSTETVDGRSITRFEGLDDISGFFGVSARDDDALVIRSTSVDDDDFEIQAWPGDDAWADFATETVEMGIPALAEFIGLDLEGEREITVAESGTPYLYGFAGWYSPSDDRIEVGDEHDRHTMLHELAHLWYHDELFTSRWVIEGLAELTAVEATLAFDEEPLPVPELDAGTPGAPRLNDWDHSAVGEFSSEQDLYGYSTSFALLDAIHGLVGTDGLQSVIARAHRRELPLAGDDDGMRRPVDDWRYFYDLLMTADDVDTSAVDDLFQTYALNDSDRNLVAARSEAMVTFGELDDADGEWTPPIAVRRILASWAFGHVAKYAGAAEKVVDDSQAIRQIVEPLDVDILAIESAYEEARTLKDLTDLHDDLARFEEAANDLAALTDRVGGRNPLQRLGTAGRDLAGRQRDAAAAFESGDLAEMDRIIEETDEILGQIPIVLVAFAAITAAAVASFLARRRLSGETDPPTMGPDSVPAVAEDPAHVSD